jgi:hypothetical protein
MVVGPEISILLMALPAVGHNTEPVRSTSRVHNLIPQVISSSCPPVSLPLFQVDIFQSQKFSNTECFTARGCYPYVLRCRSTSICRLSAAVSLQLPFVFGVCVVNSSYRMSTAAVFIRDRNDFFLNKPVSFAIFVCPPFCQHVTTRGQLKAFS